MWKGRFKEEQSDLLKSYGESVSTDWQLFRHDIRGSIAHARALMSAGILNQIEFTSIEDGLLGIQKDIESGQFEFSRDLEDVHMNIEAELTRRIGPAGAKLHTARSRNDQVALDFRLYLRDASQQIQQHIRSLQKALLGLANRHRNALMPGYTHLQRAQPVFFAHHLLAYVEMLDRDAGRLSDAAKRMDSMPLGSGAIAGSTIILDRESVARELGFSKVSTNSMDAVADRDFACELLAAIAILGMHISRLSEDVILWASAEFGFLDLSDRHTTGSSLMPQKKNPDVPELARGKTGRVVGHLMGLLTLMKGQPLAYNKDNQEDKEPLFDTVDTLKDTLRIFSDMIGGQTNAKTGKKEGGLTVNADAMELAAKKGYATATDLADYLVKKGLPFRDAHEVVAHAVKTAQTQGKDLSELSLATLQTFHAAIEQDVFDCLSLVGSLNARNTLGGTAPAQVKAQIARHLVRLV